MRAPDEESRAQVFAEGTGGGQPQRGLHRQSPLLHASRQVFRFVRRHPGASVELLLGLYLYWGFLSQPDLRALLKLLAVNAIGSFRALWMLLHVDARGTIESLGLTAGKFLIGTLPLVVVAWRWSSWGRLRVLFWLPILTVVFWPLAGASNATSLVGLSALALWSTRFRRLRWTVILPLAALGAPAANHLAGSFVWNGTPLVHRCEGNDGRRPINLQAGQLSPGYMSVSQIRPDEVLLAGQLPDKDHLPLVGSAFRGPMTGGSWWLRRTGTDWNIEARSKITEMAWKGCLIGEELWLWLPKARTMVSVRRAPDTGVESLREIHIPSNAIDSGEVVCLPEEDRVLIGEALSSSGIWEVMAKTMAIRRLAHEVGGLGALARRGKPGQLIAVNGTDLVVYSLEREEVVERTPAAIQMFGGLDVCPLDLEVALPDLTGRIRFFKPDAEGHYRFEWGMSLRAPRLVTYSPDCQYVVVTSIDDESVWLIDRALRRQIATYRAGPALRGTTFLGPREFAIADACTMSDFVF